MELLREMGRHLLIMQSSDGLLLHGELGEKIVNHYDFYAVFVSNDEYRIVNGPRTVGTLSVRTPLKEGSFLILGGRRWIVATIDEKKRVIDVKPAAGGVPPLFDGDSAQVHDRVRQEMKAVYKASELPVFLDATAKELLIEARENFHRYELASRNMVPVGKDTLLFSWSGDRVMSTLVYLLANTGLKTFSEGIVIQVCDTTPGKVSETMQSILTAGMPSVLDLAASVKNKTREKYDRFLPPDLLNEDYAAACFDIDGAERVMRELCGGN